MATKKTAAKPAAKQTSSAKAKTDPFSVRKTHQSSDKGSSAVNPPEDVKEAIDAFREAQAQAKHFYGEADLHKDKVLEYALDTFAERAYKSAKTDSFNMVGDENNVMLVVSAAGSGISEEESEDIRKNYGDEAADNLLVKDYGSIRFNAEVLAEHYDEIVDALQSLDPEILDNLFKPMLLKAVPESFELAREYASSPDEYRQLVEDLKLKMYLK